MIQIMHIRGVRGFTLIEMSIVLVIIGLVIGGVYLAQSLIRQSQLNSIGTDAQSYIRAAQYFQQKYNAVPGDLATATSYWGTMVSAGLTCPPAAGSTSPGGTLTCNGDGDGQIPWGANGEMFYFWQHLANAGMVQGTYTGIPGPIGAEDHVPGQNCPRTKVEGGGFSTQYRGYASGSNGWYDDNYGYILVLGLRHTTGTGSLTDNSLLTTAEALAVDMKFDDGLPGTGNILTYTSLWSQCATTTSSTTARYNLSVSGQACPLIFITGF
jgi:prepilin-type N-terminal cleavage/methylation domain-containing protein